jgi:HPt (histidine-containing phosphotransfer) domain-containing protein
LIRLALLVGALRMAREVSTSGPVLDLENALARLGGDRDLFADMVGYFFEDAPKLAGDIHAAVDAKDASAVRMKSHALKGIAAGCGGVRTACAAQALEDAGHSGDLSRSESLAAKLDAELTQLTRALEPHRHK